MLKHSEVPFFLQLSKGQYFKCYTSNKSFRNHSNNQSNIQVFIATLLYWVYSTPVEAQTSRAMQNKHKLSVAKSHNYGTTQRLVLQVFSFKSAADSPFFCYFVTLICINPGTGQAINKAFFPNYGWRPWF